MLRLSQSANSVQQAAFLVHMLSVLSFLNAAYTFNHQRHYRLFETSLDAPPSTPSAHRVKVDSSPIASSPMRFLSDMIVGENADARSHPDATRDIWEMAVWDPTPICLRMFCLFSPGHVLVYWLFLPVLVSDPRPSTTVFTTMVVASLISIQLLLLQSSFSQQSRDASVIHKEVLHEYDTKFVHPRTQPLMRDVGTQFSHTQPSTGDSKQYQGVDNESISTYTPTYIINRGFHTRPNPNYVEHVDSSSSKWRPIPSREISSNIMPPIQVPTNQRDMSTPIRPQTAIRQPQFRTAGTGDGGSLGVFSHANSPLRKTKSTNLMGQITANERGHSPVKRGGSPRKRSSLAPMSNGQTLSHM